MKSSTISQEIANFCSIIFLQFSRLLGVKYLDRILFRLYIKTTDYIIVSFYLSMLFGQYLYQSTRIYVNLSVSVLVF